MVELENPIVGVAFKSRNGKYLISAMKPHRHNDLFYWLSNNMKGRFKGGDWIQGFITLEGKFLNRAEAADYAMKIGQTTPEYQGELFSEDLW